jgi:hypothetical protein
MEVTINPLSPCKEHGDAPSTHLVYPWSSLKRKPKKHMSVTPNQYNKNTKKNETAKPSLPI